jgi:hypothetical protein
MKSGASILLVSSSGLQGVSLFLYRGRSTGSPSVEARLPRKTRSGGWTDPATFSTSTTAKSRSLSSLAPYCKSSWVRAISTVVTPMRYGESTLTKTFSDTTTVQSSSTAFSGFLTDIATAGGGVWGVNINLEVYAFNFSNQTFQDTNLHNFFGFLAADANDVWASDGAGDVLSAGAIAGGRYGITGAFPGTFAQMAAGGDGVWGIDSNQNIFRFDPGSGSFVKVPGFLTQIAVGSGAGVWGVAPNSGEVFTFVRP